MSPNNKISVYSATIAVTSSFLLGYLYTPALNEEQTTKTISFAEADLKEILVYNAYTKDSPNTEYPWQYMAEPYKPTTLELASAEDFYYTWYVDDHVQGYGPAVDVLFLDTGKHTVRLETALPSGETSSQSIDVTVKYVRREIRSLTDRDRETFFNAVSTLQRVPTVVGQELYGEDYFDKDYFNRVHLYYGGSSDCDHWHQGEGFVTSHIAYTLLYEKALQSVNPSISMPYWDFTMESTFYDPGSWRSSSVFSPDWFGNASPDNEMHTVTEGRWAYVPTMTKSSDEKFSRIYNSYGLLKSPWNSDSTPFMTRYKSVYGYDNNLKPSGCSEYRRALQKTSWHDMAKQLNSAAHGHIHELMGGSWNHGYADSTEGNLAPAYLTFSHEIEALSKDLWRAGFVSCGSDCTMEDATTECCCTCSDTASLGMTSYEILDQAGVLASVEYFDHEGHLITDFYDEDGSVYYEIPGYSAEQSKKMYDDMLTTLCNPGHIGDMFQATSTNDITFWVLHPTLDRLWHFKRLGHDEEYDETWDSSYTCYGHNADDLQPFEKGLFGEEIEEGAAVEYYTNAQLYQLLHPENEDLPYAYDNFNWPHCTAQGINMDN